METIRQSHDQAFEGIRAVAILCILCCHLSYGIEGMGWLGRYLGGTFNCVFFSLSALLFGKKLLMGGGNWKLVPFMRRRLKKLVLPLWIMLTAVIVLFICFDIPFFAKDVVLNYALFGWFAKLPGFGHLWFVTMIVMCYVMFVALSHIRMNRNKVVWLLWSAFFVSTFLAIVVDKLGYPGYMFLTLFYCGALFLYGHTLLRWVSHIPTGLLTVVAVGFNVAVIAMFYNGILHESQLAMYYVTAVAGILMLLWQHRVFSIYNPCTALIFVSGISYELYLVHHPFCFGRFNLYQVVNGNVPLGILFIFAVSLSLGILLKKTGQFISAFISN